MSAVRFLSFLSVFTLLGSCGGGGGGGSTTPANSGGGGSTTPTQPTNNAPSFTSANTASILEGTTAALTIEVSDEDSDDTVSQSITGGADEDLFELGVCNASRCTSNTLSFKAAPNFEKPQDANADNDYVVIVQATDATDPVEQTITISVTNAVEGRIVDAPLSDATVCLDTNEDSECGDTEPSVTSDSQGYYAVAETSPESGFELRVLSIGGTDIVTGKELPSLALIAEVPADPTQAVAVTPLSSVISVATDPQAVIVALGFPETVTPDELTSIDPWALANDNTEGSGEFAASTELAESIGITTAELETVADNVVTTSVQIANLIQTADSVVTDTTTSGIQSAAERAAMITATVTQELVETIEAAVTTAGSAAATTIDLGDSTFTTEVLKETAEESATLIVAEIETKQNAGTLDLSDTNNATVAAILEIKEAQEVVTQTGLDTTQTANIIAIATTAAETNALINTQVASAGVTVLTTASSAADIAEIVTNTSTLAEQLVTGEISTDTFNSSSDVDTQANTSGGLNDAIATFIDTDGDGIFDANDAFPNDATETLDADGDGVGDNADAFPALASETKDTDSDGVGDNADVFPNDATETLDSDSDGVGDNADLFPALATETVDTDGDGVGDNADAFPNDAAETLDSDADGVGDNADLFPNLATETIDTDSDGVGDNSDMFPNDSTESLDTDGDGIGNNADIDDDSDGLPDLLEGTYGSSGTSSESRLAMTQKGNSLFGEESGVRSGKIAINGAGNILAIGSPGDRGTTDAITQGSVQVYEFVGGAWTNLGDQLTNGLADSNFGTSLALNKAGDILVVGASFTAGRTENPSHKGQVKVFKWDGTAWSQLGGTFEASEAGTYFGQEVVLDDSGNRIAFTENGVVECPSVPCPYYSANSTVYVYDWDGSSWNQKGGQLSGVSSMSYGIDIDISGDGSTISLGAALMQNADGVRTGGVNTFRLVNDSWGSVGQTIYGDAEYDEAFYVALNRTGDVLAHGAHKNDSAGEDAGHLKIYDLIEDVWTQRGATLKGSAGDRFGGGMNLNDTGNILTVSALFEDLGDVYTYSGSVSLYLWSGSSWELLNKFNGTGDDSYMFSNSLSSDGGVLAVSARYEKSGDLTEAGRVSVYQLSVDSDSDKVADADDGYPSVSLGLLTDFDRDGRPDSCDASCQALGMSLDVDIDNDGVPDLLDIKPKDAAYFCAPPAAGIAEATPSSSSDLIFSLSSSAVDVTDYLDGNESTPAHYKATLSVSNNVLTADFGPMALDLDNLNSMLRGSGGKAPDLSVPITGLPSTQTDGNAGTLIVNLWEGSDYLRQPGERALAATIQLVWVANEYGLFLISGTEHGLVYTSTNGTAISSEWKTDGDNVLRISGYGISKPATLDMRLMDFLSKNIAANSLELSDFFSAGDYSIQFDFSGINFATRDNQQFSKIKTMFSVAKDPTPVIYGNDFAVSEGSTSANATLSFSHLADNTSVSYKTMSNSATTGADFSSVSGTISTSDIQTLNGVSSATIQVPILKDAALCENSEEFSILLSSTTAALDDPLIRVTISDDGTGSILTDADSDGVADFADLFPSDPNETIDTDSDGIGNGTDTDDDGDGVADASDAFPLDASETKDSDLDGVGDNSDPFPNDASEKLDTDMDGIGNNTDTDDDGDGTLDVDDASPLDAFPLDDTISAARTINISQWPSDFIVMRELDRADISFDPTNSGTLISLESDKTVKYHDLDDVAATGGWTIEDNQLKLSNVTDGVSSYNYYSGDESASLTNIDAAAWDAKFSNGFGQQVEVQYRTDYSYWLVSQGDGKYQLYKSRTQKMYFVDSSLVTDASQPVKIEATTHGKSTWYEYEGAQLKPFTAEELTKRWAFPIDLNSSRIGTVALSYDLADFNVDGTGKVVSTNRSFQWSTNQAGSIVVVFDDDATQRVTIGRYHSNGGIMGVHARGVISDTRVVSKYHYTMPQSSTAVDMTPFYGKDQLVLYTDPLYQNPVWDGQEYFGYVFNENGTMRNYLSISEYFIGSGNYSTTNDGWYFRDYTWSRTGNFIAAKGCRLIDYDNDGVGEHCGYAWWRDFQLLGVTDDWLVMSLRLFNHYAVVDGKPTGDLTLTGDDRTMVASYNFILKAFDNTDVDGDEVKNIYDNYPFDSTRH